MTDDRPRPKYGEYAPLPPAPAEPQYPPPVVDAAPVPTEKPRNTKDIVATTVLLLIGVWDVVTGFAMYSQFGVLLKQAYEQQGYGDFTVMALANEYGAILNIIRVVILVVVIVVSLLLLSRRRIAFWVPLVGGVVAAIAVVVFVAIILTNEPGFAEYLHNLQG